MARTGRGNPGGGGAGHGRPATAGAGPGGPAEAGAGPCIPGEAGADHQWLGQAIEVHRAPTHAGELSFAVRWHGARPALLWELQRRDGSGPGISGATERPVQTGLPAPGRRVSTTASATVGPRSRTRRSPISARR